MKAFKIGACVVVSCTGLMINNAHKRTHNQYEYNLEQIHSFHALSVARARSVRDYIDANTWATTEFDKQSQWRQRPYYERLYIVPNIPFVVEHSLKAIMSQ